MTIQKQFLVSMVVQDYLGGKPRNQIAKDRNTSTGNVSNIVEAWKKSVGIPNVDELRDFCCFVKKIRNINKGLCPGVQNCTNNEKHGHIH
jgi:hypothetical protein